MKRILKIGTRDSELAIWQGKKVQEKFAIQGIKSELVFIKSDGDINLVQPLYELGVQGIFTKSLDVALLNNKIDVAVHSYKDVPTTLAKNTVIAAVLERYTWLDVFISKQPIDELIKDKALTIATSSTRRKAQWLNKYPHHQTENIRGNINSRVKKMVESPLIGGTILSKAGVDRIDLKAPYIQNLDWMLPAPSQGTIAVSARENDHELLEICQNFTHIETEICTKIEKDFLKNLMGGCITPIGALAILKEDKIFFRGNIYSHDGMNKANVEITFNKTDVEKAGEISAQQIRENGGEEILKQLKNEIL